MAPKILGFGLAVAIAASVFACGKGKPPLSDADRWAATRIAAGTGGVQTGPCTQEGLTVECHVETGQHAGVVDCFNGTQTCVGGQWSDCGADNGGSVSSHALGPSLAGGAMHTQSLVFLDGSASASGCASNPCDPSCVGADLDAGQLQTNGFTPTIVATTTSFALLPAPKTQSNAVGLCSTSALSTTQCSYDMCCDPTAADAGTGSGQCVAWPKQTGCAACAGPDYTLAVGCQDANSGDVRVAICNRGAGDAPTSGSLAVSAFSGNPPAAGTPEICAANATAVQGFCTVDLSKVNLKAGACADLDFDHPGAGISCSGNVNSGNRYLMINDQHGQTECNYCNNFSFNYTQQAGCLPYGNQPPPPVAVSNQYVASCPLGRSLRWNQFAYKTNVPDSSEVVFTAHTGIMEDGGVGTLTSAVTLAHPATPTVNAADPAYCPMSGSATGTCPKDLYTLLGGEPAAVNPVLQLDVALAATTAVPTVYWWQFSFDCIPSE
jgi:hypothetical protein